jgi:uroporphyrin-III C-methyltransferase / precorrin-2 dehydrogenase / sirohydrochlorin ferrochelatase
VSALSINLHVADRLSVVVGGGKLATRRAAMLLSAGARVRMVAPAFCPEALAIDHADLTRVERRY